MACKFCPKIRKTDWIFILVAALGFYLVNKLGYAPQFTPTSKLSRPLPHPIEKPNNMTEEERKKRFIELQKACLLHKDKKACEEVFQIAFVIFALLGSLQILYALFVCKRAFLAVIFSAKIALKTPEIQALLS